MVTQNSNTISKITLKQLAQNNPQNINYLLDALELLMYENNLLRQIAARYSHDLRSPVTNIDMLLQLYEKAGDSPDKDLYISKMVKSVQRLQEGFETLSSERKSLLLNQSTVSKTFLSKVLAEVQQKLPPAIILTTNFVDEETIKCNAQTLAECILLLLQPMANSHSAYPIELKTEKNWNGILLTISYPEFLNLEGEDLQATTEHQKNQHHSYETLSWNYYFAVLFLRTMGAVVTVNESIETHSAVQISFIQ